MSVAEAFSGFEPVVGEVRAVRTFRVGPGGVLYPLYGRRPWLDGDNRAACTLLATALSGGHSSPDARCTCGFYAYATADLAAEEPRARHVVAVVACWGRVIAGTRGLRCEYARIEALWLSRTVPADLVRLVAGHYPQVHLYRDRSAMITDHQPDRLDVYDPPAHRRRSPMAWAWVAFALLCGAAPAVWWAAVPFGRSAYGLAALLAITCIALMRGSSRTLLDRQQHGLLCLAVALWLLAPVAGTAGLFLLRLPLVQICVLALSHRMRLRRTARTFPAVIR